MNKERIEKAVKFIEGLQKEFIERFCKECSGKQDCGKDPELLVSCMGGTLTDVGILKNALRDAFSKT